MFPRHLWRDLQVLLYMELFLIEGKVRNLAMESTFLSTIGQQPHSQKYLCISCHYLTLCDRILGCESLFNEIKF